MKKFVIGFLTGLILCVPIGAYGATKVLPDANEIYQFNKGSSVVEVFDDADNKCYLAYYTDDTNNQNPPSISCTKR